MVTSDANRRPASRCRMLIAAGQTASSTRAPDDGLAMAHERRATSRRKVPFGHVNSATAQGEGSQALARFRCVVGLLLWPLGACRNPSPMRRGRKKQRTRGTRVEEVKGAAQPMGVLLSGRGTVGDALRLDLSKNKRRKSVVAGGGRLDMGATGTSG
ncbi:hypothetical protein PSPO01_06150 [Paraphaeosphaeria sporulosa]